MENPAVPDRDVCLATVREQDVCKHKVGTGFHADMIGTGT
jgi:hypothetical protein